MRNTLILVLGLVVSLAAIRARADYVVSASPLRSDPRAGAAVVDRIDANKTVAVLGQSADFTKVRLGVGVEGWVPSKEVESRWIRVWKAERRLSLMDGETEVKSFRIALGAQHPVGDKVKQGDGATPEGRFFLGELDPAPAPSRYGTRSMRLSYPGVPHARRALQSGLIPRATYESIVRAIAAGTIPPQNTPLGGSIRIHGGGSSRDWTLGCIALTDDEVIEVYNFARSGMRVQVFVKAADEAAARGGLGKAILRGAKAQLENPARYTTHAMQALPMPFPMGDIDRGEAVCTDIIVRSLRAAGLDLQALIYEDRLLHADRYRGKSAIKANIDHRRVTNLVPFFRRFASEGSLSGKAGLRPGDVVIFDTGIQNGTPFDHIGIVDDMKDADGEWKAINIWTVGYRTQAMALIGKDYPKVVAWFRMGEGG